jgi:membrane-bound ClpP family serine protease
MPKPPQVLDNSNQIILDQLRACSSGVETATDSDCLSVISPIVGGLDDAVRRVIEDRADKRAKLSVLLETPGGFIETAQRMAETFRHHYKHVDFIVPNFAMSAGTVLALSGDAIWMDYYSTLGPIDPQFERPNGGLFPALGYLIQYERLVEKSRAGTLTSAELAYLLNSFNPAEMYRYEQAKELSIALLKEWLVKYKFKNWRRTETRGLSVTASMKTSRAKAVAEKLSDTTTWNSHGRGISMAVLRRDVRLVIDDFGADPKLDSSIRLYYRLMKDFMARLGVTGVLHWNDTFMPL